MTEIKQEINTKHVEGRRKVRYESLDDFLADARRVASSDVRMLGNWTPGQIYKHLAKSMNCSIDGFEKLMPPPMRWMLSFFMKKKFLNDSIPTGFKTSSDFIFGESSAEEGLADLEKAIDRLKNESKRSLHPGFGKITNEEWNKFHLRHAEEHMSFLVDNE